MEPQPAGLNAVDCERLAALNGTNPCVEGDDHAPAVVCGVTLLVNGPVQLLMDGDGSPVSQNLSFLEAFAHGSRESAVLFPGWGNGAAAIKFFAASGGFEVCLGGLRDKA